MSSRHPMLVLASENAPVRKPEFLWEPYLADANLAVLDGDPGVGKSFVALDLAARISAGLPMPDGQPSRTGPGRVLIASGEDSIEETLIPRFRAAGGALKQLAFFGGLTRTGRVDGPASFPRDFDHLARLIADVRPVLMILDPIMALIPSTFSANNDQLIREFLNNFARMAARYATGFLFVRHLNKTGGRKSLYSGSGSIGITGAVRSALLAGVHPGDPDRRVLSVAKANMGVPGPSLAYHIADGPAGPVVVWDGPTNLTADDLCGMPGEDPAPVERAEAWLTELLANGPVPAVRVEAEAGAAGVSFTTLRAAKKRLRVESRRVVRDGKATWEWVWPEDGLQELEAM